MANEMILANANEKTLEEKKALFNIITNAETKLSDCVNKEIDLVDFVFTEGSTTDEQTGEILPCERVIAVDVNGASYHSMAQGLVSSFKQLALCFGEPATWSEPLKITIVKKAVKKGQTYIVQVL